jgi:hypothetical protein
VRQVRHTVRFFEGMRTLESLGVKTFLELGPQGTLCTVGQEALSDEAQTRAAFLPALRKDRPEVHALTAALGALHARGLPLDWTAFFAPLRARRVDLPTYAFQRKRFWLDAPKAQGADVTSAGLSSADHPLLGAAVALADSDGFLFTGRLSLSDHPWLSDHAIFGTVLLPGTAFVELALLAAHRVGLDRIDELTLEAALALPAKGAVVVQLSVSSPDDTGRRSLTLHARPEDAPPDASWTRHATGLLGPSAPFAPIDLRLWPPAGAVPLALDGLYDRLADAGVGYGPHFQGLRAAWKRGEELFAEVHLPEEIAKEASHFALHPALLDAALHALTIEAVRGAGDIALPFSWAGVSLHAIGASSLRVRFGRRQGENTVSLTLADATGEPVRLRGRLGHPARVCRAAPRRPGLPPRLALSRRLDTPVADLPVSAARAVALVGSDDFALTPALQASALRIERYADLAALLATLAQGAPLPEVVVIPWTARSTEVVSAAHEATGKALALLQTWLADDRLASSRLVLLTQRAIAAQPDGGTRDRGVPTHAEDVLDLVHAPLWGLVRSAQAENPDLPILLVDIDDRDASRRALPAALASAEPQLALRDGQLRVPRLTRSAPPPRARLVPSTPRARSSSRAALARSAPWSPGIWCNTTASSTCFSPRARGLRLRAPRPCKPSSRPPALASPSPLATRLTDTRSNSSWPPSPTSTR